MMRSYTTCFSHFLPLLQKTQGKREETWPRAWYLGKIYFPKELIPFIMISITVFNKTRHQRTLSHLWAAETQASSEGKGILLGRETEGTRLPLPGGGIRPPGMVALICRGDTGSRNTGAISCDILMQRLTQHLALASGCHNDTNTTKKKNATVWKGYSKTRITDSSFSVHTTF